MNGKQFISQFTKQGIMEHGTTYHKGVKGLKKRSVAYTKEMVIIKLRHGTPGLSKV